MNECRYRNKIKLLASVKIKTKRLISPKTDVCALEIPYSHLTVNCNIPSISNVEITKVTPAIVCEAITHLKGNRNDPIFQFASDSLLNAPAILYDHLACVFRSYLIHGQISNILMLSTLIPLVKGKLGDICASNNFCYAFNISGTIQPKEDESITNLLQDDTQTYNTEQIPLVIPLVMITVQSQ